VALDCKRRTSAGKCASFIAFRSSADDKHRMLQLKLKSQNSFERTGGRRLASFEGPGADSIPAWAGTAPTIAPPGGMKLAKG
jgi:hypothetical protein